MAPLESALLMIHLLVAVAICGFVLLQHGKGADMGAAFGGGSAGSVFGSAGSANFLSRTTAILAAVFFLSSVGLTYFGTQHARSPGGGVMDRVPVEQPASKGTDSGAAPAKAADTSGVPAKADAAVKPVPAGAPVAPSKSGEVPK
ncbi:MAG: preprotein translocase subunit SecG [Casimicrobiaceae bacterium]